jgi:peptide/nickel transport system permease protein
VTQYIVRRLLGIVPTLLLLVLAVVVMMRMMPADIIDVLLSEQAADPTLRGRLEHHLGLDKSVPEQYVAYLAGLPRGDLGTSLLTGRPVRDMIGERLNVTVELAFFALLVGGSAGAAVGVLSAIYQDSALDYLLRSLAIVGLTVPNFALATAVVLLPAIYFHWSPPLVYVPLDKDIAGHFQQFLLPSLVLGTALTGATMRITRTQVLEVLRQDYVRTARMKGLGEQTVIVRHVLRNAMLPVLSVFGLQVAALVSGTVILENIFALPGLGRLLLAAVTQRDYPVVQGITLVVGIGVMCTNLVVDLSYGLFDPRVKIGVSR